MRLKKSVRDLLVWGKEELHFLGENEAKVNTEQLLEEVTELTRLQLYLELNQTVAEKCARKFERLIERRKARVPLAYLLGKAYFWNETLAVTPDCLIPRPETEILIEQFLATSGFGHKEKFSFLDLGCGSGAIGIALLRSFPNAVATFSDVSKRALNITRKNLQAYQLTSRAECIQSDLFAGLKMKKRRWNSIVSNPPYLSAKDLLKVEPELKREPQGALDGGKDGFDFYRRIIAEAPDHLETEGFLALEMGIGQSKKVSALLKQSQFKNIQIFKDHARIDRVITAKKVVLNG